MPRQARVVLPGVPHHVTHRGNYHQVIFHTPNDRNAYLGFLLEAATGHNLEIHAYCLMTNHIHLLLTPQSASELSRGIQKAHLNYAIYVNAQQERAGHLWLDRFHSCPLDEEHYWQALRYVECNPVRAGLTTLAREYIWSSARAHIARSGESRLLDLPKWRSEMAPEEWKKILSQEQPEAEIDCLRRNAYTGRPLGTTEFVATAEATLGRRLHAKPVGRPRR